MPNLRNGRGWPESSHKRLARLWHAQGKGAEAHRRLAAVYNWFTEGFDTADLQEAQARLVKLTPGEKG